MSLIIDQIATELSVAPSQISAAVKLLDDGATVPFISRYRKEVTGALDDTQLRKMEERLIYLRELENRKQVIIKSIQEQGKLTPELNSQITAANTKTELEDLYLPYKPKRRTKGQIAIESGLEPLSITLFTDPSKDPTAEAAAYVDPEKQVHEIKDALDGAKYILMEKFAEDAALLAKLRRFLWQEGELTSVLIAGKESSGQKFSDYFEFSEKLKKIPSHRALAMFRGRNEGVLALSLTLGEDQESRSSPCEAMIAGHFNIQNQDRPGDKFLSEVVRWCWKVKLLNHMESELFGEVRQAAEQEAINVFARNLKDLLLAAPAGPKATLGMDPGLRTGVKLAVINATGQVMDHGAIFPTPPQNKIKESEQILVALCKKFDIELIAIGNGTASRETETFVTQVLKNHPDINARKVVVNEAGASVYSASELAASEFPELDVTIRGAVSIARRLQDPLAELVKIDPRSIGVGQYQHDVSQTALARQLDAVVEDCVNSVGVDLNTASEALLARVSGLTTMMAKNIVKRRHSEGAFNNRQQLKDVARIGPKAFEQSAGFLRINLGENPLDASGVHPESYQLVDKIAAALHTEVARLIGDTDTLKSVSSRDFIQHGFGEHTVKDVLAELDKPGRDPRPEFKTARFDETVQKITDLKPGMRLEGTITNVTNFGAFVDIGVHQDGLVHISALSHQFVKDPAEVVHTGDIVQVKVISIDIDRKRIGLSMRMDDEADSTTGTDDAVQTRKPKKASTQHQPATNTMASLFDQAKKGQKSRL